MNQLKRIKPLVSLLMVWALLVSTILTALPLSVVAETGSDAPPAIEENHLRIHYEHTGTTDEQLYLWSWGDVVENNEGDWPLGNAFKVSDDASYNMYTDIELKSEANEIGVQVVKAASENEKVVDDTTIEIIAPEMNEVWISAEGDVSLYQPVDFAEPTVRIYYQETEAAYTDPGLWFWGDVVTEPTEWAEDAYAFNEGTSSKYGNYIDIKLTDGPASIGMLIVDKALADGEENHQQSDNINFDDLENHQQIFLQEGHLEAYTNPYYISSEEETEPLPEETPGEAEITATAAVSRAFNYDEHAILSVLIDNQSALTIQSIRADVSALGRTSALEISPELNEVVLSVQEDIATGEKDIPITIVDSAGGTYTTTATAEITEKTEDSRDWDESIIYFMLTDRFFDGDESNNNPYDLAYNQADNPRGTYQGGDFEGVTAKLDYLDELGVNTIWVTPIVENVGHDVEALSDNGSYYAYHGYWAENFETLNPHLGTLAEFHTLIDEAAARDIDIMVDVVLNHAGYGMNADLTEGMPEGHPTAEDLARFDGMLREDSGSGDLKMSLSGLPDFVTEDQQVREDLVEWQSAWVEKSTTANGNRIASYRVDTVKHVDQTTWQLFKNELVKLDPSFKLIGEHWGANYQEDGGHFNDGTMDSLLDFGFKTYAEGFINGHLSANETILIERNASLTNTYTLGQFLGSHDENGFLYEIDNDVDKYKVAASLQLTAKGQPVIYYGEEIGQTGENNWPVYDNRYDFDWEAVESSDIHDHYQTVLRFRNEFSKVLAKGNRETVVVNDELGHLISKRSHNGTSVYLGFNVTDQPQEISLNTSTEEVIVTDHYSGDVFSATATDEGAAVTVTIPAMADGGTVLLSTEGGELLSVTDTPTDEEVNENEVTPVEKGYFRLHFRQLDRFDLSSSGLWIWEDVATSSENWPLGAINLEEAAVQTEFGHYIDVEIKEDASQIGFLINNASGDNLTGDQFVDVLSPDMNEAWITEDFDVYPYQPVNLDGKVRINYHREDGDYQGWALWTWGDVVEPTDGWPDGAHDFVSGDYGVFYDLPLIEDASQINFLTLNKESGNQSSDMSFGELEQSQIFIRDGDVNVYTNPYFVTEEGLTNADFTALDTIELSYSLVGDWTKDDLIEAIEVTTKEGDLVSISDLTIKKETNKISLHGDFKIDDAPYTVTHLGREQAAKAGWRLKDSLYGYDGDLGLTALSNGEATIKVWSPSADDVALVLYDKDNPEVMIDKFMMQRTDQGVYAITLTDEVTGIENHEGYFYHFEVTRGEETVLAIDPYARSMAQWSSEVAVDSVGKAAIVDPSTIGPTLDYADIDGFEHREDAIIYEVHVRDFTSDPSIEAELDAQFGTFSAFREKLDYIESLGVTHVQLLPVMSYYFSNEFANDQRLLEYSSTDNNYNWGYDPHSYFSLTGMYSEDPSDPAKRIEEFKALIADIHSRGMGVILDVVYNHTARVEIFEDLEPNYYHFMDEELEAKTSFGGGRLGTTHKMSRRILVDSITYWVEQFKVDGFRFDMMGDHDAASIQMAYDKAKQLNPNILMIGEGWRTFAGDDDDPNVQPADQDWMKDTNSVGSFSDEFRNELKSGFGSEGQPRFLTGGARNVEQIFNNLTANPGNFTATHPGDVVPYIAAHDNLTLHDVIAQSIKKDPKDYEEEIHQRIRLGNLMVLTSQGTPFIHAGQEFGRTKQFKDPDFINEVEVAPYKSTFMTDASGEPFEFPYFIHDSYDSTDVINNIEWDKATNREAYPVHTMTQRYTSGLIHLRRSTDAFRKATMAEIESDVKMINAPEINTTDLVVAYQATDSKGDTYHVFINADSKARALTVETNYLAGDVLVDGQQAGTDVIEAPVGVSVTENTVTLAPLTAFVVRINADPSSQPDEDHAEEPPNTSPVIPDEEETTEIDDDNLDVDEETDGTIVDGNDKTDLSIKPDLFEKLTDKAQLKMRGKANTFSMNFPLSNVLKRAKDQNQTIRAIVKQIAKAETPKKKGVEPLSDAYDLSIFIGDHYVDEAFETPVELRFTVNSEAVTDQGDIRLVYINNDGEFIYYPIDRYNAETGEVIAFVTHFSQYMIAMVNDAVVDAPPEERPDSEPVEGETSDTPSQSTEDTSVDTEEGVVESEVAPVLEDETTSTDDTLPDTAHSFYRNILVGLLLIVVAAVGIIGTRRKESK